MDRISIDLDELEDDLQQATHDFDLALSQQLNGAMLSDLSDDIGSGMSDSASNMPTLESILNEDDDFDNDEILKTLTYSLTTIDSVKNDSSSLNETPRRKGSSISRSSSIVSSMNTSHHQYNSLVEKNGLVCRQTQMKQISSQLITAIERSEAGLPTVLTVSSLIAVGTSRGLILLFDSHQALKLYITTEYKDAISALSLNNKCDRLLVGNSLGHIFMFDTLNGKLLRKITEAHPYGNAILNLKFTDDPTLACFSDSGGSVFMLEFKRVMGVRSADSTCIFSGSRGEVCDIAPLRFERFAEGIIEKLDVSGGYSNRNAAIKRSLESITSMFNRYALLAMVSFTKLFVVTLRPKLTVLFTYSIAGSAKYLPIVNWQFVIMQPTSLDQTDERKTGVKRYVTPILACARESTIHFFQVDFFKAAAKSGQNETAAKNMPANELDYTFKFVLLKKSQYKFKIYNFCWLNAKTLAILDNTEKLHIVDIRTDEELQVLSNVTESVQLVYNSSFFKSLSTGGYVSKALAYAGENACYQTFQAHSGYLYALGKRSITQFILQTWSERIDDFVNDGNLDLAIDLASSMYKGETKALIGLPIDSRLRKQKIIDKLVDLLNEYIDRAMKQDCPTNGKLDVLERHYKKVSQKCVNACILINRQDILFDSLYSLLSQDSLFEGFFFESLQEYLLNDRLKDIPPQTVKSFIDYYANNPDLHVELEKCLLHFDIACLDLHSVMQICQRFGLLDGFIYLNNKAFNDFVTPLDELIKMMSPLMLLHYDTARHYLKEINANKSDKSQQQVITIGNKLLVYLHCCLCGQAYPYGILGDDQLSDRVRRETFAYLTGKRAQMIDDLLVKEKQKPTLAIKKYLDDFLDEQNSLAGAYPIIRIFLNFDVLDFLNVLEMACNESSFEAVIGLDKKQQLIDILIEIAFNKSSYLRASSQLAGHLFTFLARQISNKNNNIQIENSVFSEMIEYLCDTEESDRLEEREQSLLSLLNSFSLELTDRFDLDRMLSLAWKAKFYRVCEVLYEFRGEYYEIVDCYLTYNYDYKPGMDDRQKQIFEVVRSLLNILYEQDMATTNNSASSASLGTLNTPGIVSSTASLLTKKRLSITNMNQRVRAFTQYRSNSIINVEPRDVQLKKLQEKLLRPRTLKKMISISAMETIHLLWTEMNIDLKYLIHGIKSWRRNGKNNRLSLSSSPKFSLLMTAEESDDVLEEDKPDQKKSEEDDPEAAQLLYTFMKGLFELVELIKIDRKYINYISQFNSEYCEIFIDLICRFEPDKLLYELRTTLSEYSYRIDECLRICRQRKHWDGAAYLLEKSGQIEAAFMLYLEKLTSYIKELQKSLESMTERDLNILKSRIDAMLIMIVQLCQRNNCSVDEPVKEKIWFSLFEEIMKPIRSLFIHPSIEALLNYGESKEKENSSKEDEEVKQRLNETREFFKNLGNYIINSMVGYLSLTTIIDRIIVGDPVYGATNFGDIKDLMIKMLEMCSYEQILLTKTSSLVSQDVYHNMMVYKRLSCQSYSMFDTFCNYCSRPLDLNQSNNKYTAYDTASLSSIASGGQQPLSPPNRSASPIGSPSDSDSKISISLFHCGHSFHQVCLEIGNFSTSTCPICNPTSSSTEKSGVKSRTNKNQAKRSEKRRALEFENFEEPVTLSQQPTTSNSDTSLVDMSPQRSVGQQQQVFKSSLSKQQIDSLKQIRKRNSHLFRIDTESLSDLERNGKLTTAPANLLRFV